MQEKVYTFQGARTVISTTRPYEAVIAALDVAVNRSYGTHWTEGFPKAQTIEELENDMTARVGPGGFMFFEDVDFAWFDRIFKNGSPIRRKSQYIIGNPLLAAKAVLVHEEWGALNVPARILMLEKADGKGTEIHLYKPFPGSAEDKENSVALAFQEVDNKLENMARSIANDENL